jgi:hypothetical protein
MSTGSLWRPDERRRLAPLSVAQMLGVNAGRPAKAGIVCGRLRLHLRPFVPNLKRQYNPDNRLGSARSRLKNQRGEPGYG